MTDQNEHESHTTDRIYIQGCGDCLAEVVAVDWLLAMRQTARGLKVRHPHLTLAERTIEAIRILDDAGAVQ